MHDLMLKVAIMLLSPPKYLFSTEIEIWATVLCPPKSWHNNSFLGSVRYVSVQKIIYGPQCNLFSHWQLRAISKPEKCAHS